MKKPGNDSCPNMDMLLYGGKVSLSLLLVYSVFSKSRATHKKGQNTEFITYGERIGKRIFFLCRFQLLRCNINL